MTEEVKRVLRRKGTIIAVAAVVMALVVSAGVAIAAGTSNGEYGVAGYDTGIAGENLSFECRNTAEGNRIRAMSQSGVDIGECEGDCDRERLRDRECDGDCQGEGTQSRTRQGDGQELEPEAAGQQAANGAQNGACAGDSLRDRERLCDGSCDGECDGDGTQERIRGGN